LKWQLLKDSINNNCSAGITDMSMKITQFSLM